MAAIHGHNNFFHLFQLIFQKLEMTQITYLQLPVQSIVLQTAVEIGKHLIQEFQQYGRLFLHQRKILFGYPEDSEKLLIKF